MTATASAQNNTCSQKLETLGSLLSIEAKLQRLSNREHTKEKLAQAILVSQQFSAERQLNTEKKFKDYYQDFRTECGALEKFCQPQVNAFLTASQIAGKNSGSLAEAEALKNDYSVQGGQLGASIDQALIKSSLDAARACLNQ